jgi:hypothetical protein
MHISVVAVLQTATDIICLFVCLFVRVTKFGLTAGEGYQENKNSVAFNMVYYFDIFFRSHLQRHI